jgi:hypothetical protein
MQELSHALDDSRGRSDPIGSAFAGAATIRGVTGPYATVIIVISLVLAFVALVLALLNRSKPLALLVGAALLEVLLVGFLVGGIVQMVGSDHDFARAEFVGYLLACVALVPLALWWAWGEASRAGLVVIGVALLVLPILVIRVQQVWAGTSG